MKTEWIIWAAGAVMGGIAGWLYWRYVGCSSGSCPITARPLSSTIYGAVIGLLLATFVAPAKSSTRANNKTNTEINKDVRDA